MFMNPVTKRYLKIALGMLAFLVLYEIAIEKYYDYMYNNENQ
jgi:hypothetical protein